MLNLPPPPPQSPDHKFCGRFHKPKKCTAFGQECHKCKNKNHWTSCCLTNKVDEDSESKVGHRCRNQCDNTANIQTDIRSNQDRRNNNKQQQYGGANIPVEEKIMVICEFGHKNQLSGFYVMRTDFKGVLRLYR